MEGVGDNCHDPCGESFAHTTDAIFLLWSTPALTSAWDKAIAPVSALSLPHLETFRP